jgi:methylmalonyl-CoA mutase cobalamin-binding domain/chain
MYQKKIDALIHYLLEGNTQKAVSSAKDLHNEGVSKEQIIIQGLEETMVQLGAKCTLEQFNLLEIMLSGRAVMEVMKYLYPDGNFPEETKGTVVIAALEGDVHDLGKNILKMVLMAKGYCVVDCGKDCSIQRLVDTAKEKSPFAIGISGLITSIIPLVKQVRDALNAQGLNHIKIMAGGAALKQSLTKQLNVDFIADSAFDGVHYLEKIRGIKNE